MTHDNIEQWLTQTERLLKDLELKSTLEEKLTQLNKLKSVKTDVESHQADVDKFTDVAQTLINVVVAGSDARGSANVTTSADPRVGANVTLTSQRYDALRLRVSELIDKWQRLVHDHEMYRDAYNDLTSWIAATKHLLDDASSTTSAASPSSSRDAATIEAQRQQLARVIAEKDVGYEKLNRTVEYGDVLYPDTAQSGRDKIRHQIRLAKEVWDSLLADISKQQSVTDTALLHWSAYSDAAQQIKVPAHTHVSALAASVTVRL